MDRLIITADDRLYQRLADQARADDDVPYRASDALSGLHRAVSQRPGMVLLDMALRSADTLLETLHSRPETAAIPLLAVVEGARLPFELRRFCAAVLARRSASDADDGS
jgi:DNA-binding response OmpR family regulator